MENNPSEENKFLKKNPKNVDKLFSNKIQNQTDCVEYYFSRANAFKEREEYSKAKSEICEAFLKSKKNNNIDNVNSCYYQLALIFHSEKKYASALKNFEQAKNLNYKKEILDLCILRCKNELAKSSYTLETDQDGLLLDDLIKEIQSELSIDKSERKCAVENVVIKKQELKDDMFQTENKIIILLYIKNVNKNSIKINSEPKLFFMSFLDDNGQTYEYKLEPLYSEIEHEKTTYHVYLKKIEITFIKKIKCHWVSKIASNEKNADYEKNNKKNVFTYPSSHKNSINWSEFKLNPEYENSSDDLDFFKKLYKDVDDETKRAMIKSYVESNGTVLTTNWNEAKSKTYKTQPSPHMEEKKWNN